MPIETLTELQYSEDEKGPWQLYIYRADGMGYQTNTWFARKIDYPGEEINVHEARDLTRAAFDSGREIRIVDGGDMLVFHAIGNRVLYGQQWWKKVMEDGTL